MFGGDTNPGTEHQNVASDAAAAGMDSSDVAAILQEAGEMAGFGPDGEQPEEDAGDSDESFEGAAGDEDEADTQADESEDETPDAEGMPDDYAERWKKMEAAHTRRSQELAELRREAEAERARLREVLERVENRTNQSGKDQSGVPDAEPTPPGEEATQADWVKYNKDMQLWAAAQVYKNMQSQDPDIAAIRQQRALQERSAMIEHHLNQQEGYSPEVAEAMTQIVQEQPALQKLVWGEGDDFEGVDYIYSLAMKKVSAEKAAKKAAETKKRQAKAAKQAGSRPSDARGGVPVPDEDLSDEDKLFAEARRLAGF